MRIIAKIAIVGAAIGGLGIAGTGSAVADSQLPRTVNMSTISADAPFDDFDDYVRGEIHQQIHGWPGWHHNWRDDDWDDDRWDD